MVNIIYFYRTLLCKLEVHWRSITHCCLVLVPAIFLIISLKMWKYIFPMYIGNTFSADPSYAYLFSSLPILHFSTPDMVLHPGTPLQVLIAIIVGFLSFLFELVSGVEVDLGNFVILNSEAILKCISFVLLSLNVYAMYWLGKRIYKTTNNLMSGIIVQLFPFALSAYIIVVQFVCAEALQLTFAMWFLGLIAPDFFCNGDDTSSFAWRANRAGLVLGLGLATKLTMVPFIFLLFIYRKNTMSSLVFTLIGFALGTLPAWGGLVRSLEFFFQAAIHTDADVSNQLGLLYVPLIWGRIKTLRLEYKPAFYIFSATFLCFILHVAIHTYNSNKQYIRSIIVFFTAILGAILMIIKHFTVHSFAIYSLLAYFMLSKINNDAKSILGKFVLYGFFVYIVQYSWVAMEQRFDVMRLTRAEEMTYQTIINNIDSSPHVIMAFSQHSHTYKYALRYGNWWDSNRYLNNLINLGLSSIFYESTSKTFLDQHGNAMTNENISSLISKGYKIYLLSSNDNTLPDTLDCVKISDLNNGKAIFTVIAR